MEVSLNKDYNGIVIDFGYFRLHLIDQNDKLGFSLSSDYKLGEKAVVIEPNIGLEYGIYNNFRDFIAQVIGTSTIEGIDEIKKYPKDFIKIDNKNIIVSLKGYDRNNNLATLKITYDMNVNQIRINVNPSMVDTTYYFPVLRDNKEYYGECLSCYAKMVESLKKTYLNLVVGKVPNIKPTIPKTKDFKVITASVKNGRLENFACLKNENQEMAIVEDNLGTIHIFSLNDYFIIRNNPKDENERKVFNIVRETMELIFGHVTLATVDELRDVRVSFKNKKINFDNITLTYNEDKIIFDFRKVKKNMSNQYHAIIEMSGLRNAGMSYDIKKLLYNLLDNYEINLNDKKDKTLGRRK